MHGALKLRWAELLKWLVDHEHRQNKDAQHSQAKKSSQSFIISNSDKKQIMKSITVEKRTNLNKKAANCIYFEFLIKKKENTVCFVPWSKLRNRTEFLIKRVAVLIQYFGSQNFSHVQLKLVVKLDFPVKGKNKICRCKEYLGKEKKSRYTPFPYFRVVHTPLPNLNSRSIVLVSQCLQFSEGHCSEIPL